MKGPLPLAFVSFGGRHKTRALKMTQRRFKVASPKCRLQVSLPEGDTSLFIMEKLPTNGFRPLVQIGLNYISRICEGNKTS